MTYRPSQYVKLKVFISAFILKVPQSRFCASFMLKNAKEKYFGEKNGEKRGKKFFGAHLKISSYKCSFRIYIIFYHMRPFNKTTATLVTFSVFYSMPHPPRKIAGVESPVAGCWAVRSYQYQVPGAIILIVVLMNLFIK